MPDRRPSEWPDSAKSTSLSRVLLYRTSALRRTFCRPVDLRVWALSSCRVATDSSCTWPACRNPLSCQARQPADRRSISYRADHGLRHRLRSNTPSTLMSVKNAYTQEQFRTRASGASEILALMPRQPAVAGCGKRLRPLADARGSAAYRAATGERPGKPPHGANHNRYSVCRTTLDIQAHDIGHLFKELRVAREFKARLVMRTPKFVRLAATARTAHLVLRVK